ncbi:MAG: hypothetical protein ACYDEY_00380 [Acidimicrobiales bacterium]
MGFMDKVKSQATQAAQKAQEAASAGQAKIEEAQAKRRADGLLRDLGAAVYAERTGRGTADTQASVDRLIAELQQYEATRDATQSPQAPPQPQTPPQATGGSPWPEGDGASQA